MCVACRPTVAILATLFELLLGACTHPTTEPHEAHALRIGSWALASADEVCACLIAHAKTTAGKDRALTCSDEPLEGTASGDLPMSIVRIAGAERPLAYLVYTPTEGYRRVLAEYRGQPGMRFSAAASPSAAWHSGIRLVQVTTQWTGSHVARGTRSLSFCLAKPPRNDMNFPVCAFTTLIERWSVTANVEGNDGVPSGPEEPQQAWSVAIDRTYGAALVVQVRGEPDPSVPTGAFRIQPPSW
jgi:hypothetical protein